MGRRVYIIGDKCVGCGMCQTTCPEVFKLENDVSTVILNEGGPEKMIKAAKEHCPGGSIQFEK